MPILYYQLMYNITTKGGDMLTEPEIKVLFHILNCISPDLALTDQSRWKLKPQGEREYVDTISLSEDDYKALKSLKEKISAALFNFKFLSNGEG